MDPLKTFCVKTDSSEISNSYIVKVEYEGKVYEFYRRGCARLIKTPSL